MKRDVRKAAKGYHSSLDPSFPPLITFSSLEKAESSLSETAETMLDGERYPSGETLSVPRRSGGAPRPVTVLPPPVSVAYSALTDTYSEVLPTRTAQDYAEFHGVGLSGNATYVVESDIASCYEYVNHDLLRLEMLKAKPGGLAHANELRRLLSETHPRHVGLPQMNTNSDRLADLYISAIVKQARLAGYDIYSYADDFKVLVHDWAEANTCVEDLSEFARSMGLVLSQHKTVTWRAERLREREAESTSFFRQHLLPAEGKEEVSLVNPYDVKITVGQAPNFAGASALIERWSERGEEIRQHPWELRLEDRFITQALLIAAAGQQAIDNETLTDFVFFNPHRLSTLPFIMLQRSNNDQNDPLIDSLVTSGRQSAWFKLWMMHLIQHRSGDLTSAQETWLLRQFDDRHEVIRAESAWVASQLGLLTSDHLERAYRSAGPLTMHTLAACSAHLPTSKSLHAIGNDGPLNKAAKRWAEEDSGA
ncbi:reverse transcriptase domain-containing protein [Serinicoccus chungangensis]|uniref:reverse transcriptase domain-containing protein n=1 Tax=Serinicoccus chungangensis TaxID=767452 RepID=UPI0013053821|nr:reverse transcriptase domain-containing protein [Serinicoccus chungangensis]